MELIVYLFYCLFLRNPYDIIKDKRNTTRRKYIDEEIGIFWRTLQECHTLQTRHVLPIVPITTVNQSNCVCQPVKCSSLSPLSSVPQRKHLSRYANLFCQCCKKFSAKMRGVFHDAARHLLTLRRNTTVRCECMRCKTPLSR